jgi:hypothetical protein
MPWSPTHSVTLTIYIKPVIQTTLKAHFLQCYTHVDFLY